MELADRLGSFDLDVRTNSLVRAGRSYPLRPKAWLVLQRLADRQGFAVGAHELFEHAWPGIAVGPKTLTNVIVELRRALAADPSVRLVTRHRLGYCIIVDEPSATGCDPPVRDDDRICVGREAELSRLEALWQKAQDGHRQIVLLSGFAGIGKTTLVETFATRLRQQAAPGSAGATATIVARGACLDRQSDPEPYGPFAEVLECALEQADIVPLLQRVAPSWLVRLPWLLPAAEMAVLRASLAGIGSSRVLHEAAKAVEVLAAERPTLLLLEDIHYADNETLDLVAAIAMRNEPARLMVLVTYRPRPLDAPMRSVVDSLAGRASVTIVALDPLSAHGIHDYLAKRLGDEAIARRMVSILETKSGGKPLFLAELVNALVAEGWLVRGPTGWQLTRSLADIEVFLPDGIGDLIARHVAEFRSDDLALLEAASLIGEEFDEKLLAEACERSVESVSEACRRLAQSSQFLQFAEQRLLPDGLPWDVYRFRHGLYREGLARRLPASRRRTLNRRIADAMEREHAGADLPEVALQLAMHCAEAGMPDRQLHFLDVATAHALECCAYSDAIRHLQSAVAISDHVHRSSPDDAEMRTQGRRCMVLGNLSGALRGLCDPRTVAAFARAREIGEQIGSLELRVRGLLGLCTSLSLGSDPAAREAAAELLSLADENHPEMVAPASVYASLVAARSGDFREAVTLAERAHANWDPANPPFPMWTNLTVLIELLMSHNLTLVADLARAGVHERLGLEALAAGASPHERCFLSRGLAEGAMYAGDAERTLEHADRALAVGAEFGFDVNPAAAAALRAWARCRLGTGTLDELEMAIAHRSGTTETWQQSVLLAYLAEECLRRGDVVRAALALAEIELREPLFESEIRRVEGMVMLAQNRRDDGLAAIESAIEIASAQGGSLFEARARALLAAESRFARQ